MKPNTYLIGESAVMIRIRALIHRVAPTALPILLQGPTGSGKEIAAKEIHLVSQRSGAFVQFNASGLAESIAESELFGHVRGAFTGAYIAAPGLLATAHQGTVLIDEIADLSPAIQAKLLRALDSKEVRAVGATHTKHYDFRSIAAANKNLRQLVDIGTFREDLYHRLNGITIYMPPLREHREDIPVLVEHFQTRILAEDHICKTIRPSAISELQRYEWPGNIRQLYQTLRRTCILTEAAAIDAAHIREALATDDADITTRDTTPKEILLAALTEYNGNVNAVAKHFSVHISTIYRRMRDIGVSSRNTTRTTNKRNDNEPARSSRANFAYSGENSRET